MNSNTLETGEKWQMKHLDRTDELVHTLAQRGLNIAKITEVTDKVVIFTPQNPQDQLYTSLETGSLPIEEFQAKYRKII